MADDGRQIRNVKPVTFQRFDVSDDGESLIFQVADKSGKIGHIAISWRELGTARQLMDRAGERAKVRREQLNKHDDHDGSEPIKAQLVQEFQVVQYPDRNLKVLALHSKAGFRFDFAIPTDTTDQRGRPMHRAIAEELSSEETETKH